jgi:hypothetical protein
MPRAPCRVHEPAIALVELVNENSIVESWVANRLRGKNTRKNPGTWSDITGFFKNTNACLKAFAT